MIYVILALVALLAVVSVIAFVFHKQYKKFKKSYEDEHTQFLLLQQEYSNLAKAYKIKKDNKETADAKISDLHNGTTSADDILPKRKSRA